MRQRGGYIISFVLVEIISLKGDHCFPLPDVRLYMKWCNHKSLASKSVISLRDHCTQCIHLFYVYGIKKFTEKSKMWLSECYLFRVRLECLHCLRNKMPCVLMASKAELQSYYTRVAYFLCFLRKSLF